MRIYLKLIDGLSETRWTALYSALEVTEEIVDGLKSLAKANPEPLQDEPEAYHIRDSDPIDSSENGDIDAE